MNASQITRRDLPVGRNVCSVIALVNAILVLVLRRLKAQSKIIGIIRALVEVVAALLVGIICFAAIGSAPRIDQCRQRDGNRSNQESNSAS